MADFYTAYKITKKHEGGYSNDGDDAGGETYKGIARRFNPSWRGWVMIDSQKSDSDFPTCLDHDDNIEKSVKSFYKSRYWDINLLDGCPSQNIANEMFDTGVNMGVSRAAKFLQKSLNLLNKKGLIYQDVVEDGKMGPNTLKALKQCIAYRGDENVYKLLNIFQGMHYINYMTKSPTQEKYAYGWLSRVDFIRK